MTESNKILQEKMEELRVQQLKLVEDPWNYNWDYETKFLENGDFVMIARMAGKIDWTKFWRYED